MRALAIFAAQILLLTYSTSSRHGGQAKAGFGAPLAQPHRDEAGSEYGSGIWGQSSLFAQRHERRSRGWLCLDGSAAGQHASGIDMRVRAR
jgi:hypothetical protein